MLEVLAQITNNLIKYCPHADRSKTLGLPVGGFCLEITRHCEERSQRHLKSGE